MGNAGLARVALEQRLRFSASSCHRNSRVLESHEEKLRSNAVVLTSSKMMGREVIKLMLPPLQSSPLPSPSPDHHHHHHHDRSSHSESFIIHHHHHHHHHHHAEEDDDGIADDHADDDDSVRMR